jgi:hypothetical protein
MGRRADAHAGDALKLWEAWPDDRSPPQTRPPSN